MDRRKIELQLRAVLVTHRVEVNRRDAPTMKKFRERALALLDGLDDEARPYPDLAEQIREARQELDGGPRLPADE
jgi:hypothetical protein